MRFALAFAAASTTLANAFNLSSDTLTDRSNSTGLRFPPELENTAAWIICGHFLFKDFGNRDSLPASRGIYDPWYRNTTTSTYYLVVAANFPYSLAVPATKLSNETCMEGYRGALNALELHKDGLLWGAYGVWPWSFL